MGYSPPIISFRQAAEISHLPSLNYWRSASPYSKYYVKCAFKVGFSRDSYLIALLGVDFFYFTLEVLTQPSGRYFRPPKEFRSSTPLPSSLRVSRFDGTLLTFSKQNLLSVVLFLIFGKKIIMTNSLFDRKNPPKVRKDPALPLSAQSPGLCAPGTEVVQIVDSFLSRVKSNIYVGEVEFAVIELLYSYGLRISEVLSISSGDVSITGHIMVSTSKTGEPRIIQPKESSLFWCKTYNKMLPIGRFYDRFYFYRLFKKLGFTGKYGNNVNQSVTHYFRHQLVKNLISQGFTKESVSKFLAHRSKKTLEYYVK